MNFAKFSINNTNENKYSNFLFYKEFKRNHKIYLNK